MSLMPTISVPLISAFLVLATAATAQPDTATPSAESETTPVSTQTEPISPTDAENPDRDAGAAEDYRASEQISEDSSVSFPVDI